MDPWLGGMPSTSRRDRHGLAAVIAYGATLWAAAAVVKLGAVAYERRVTTARRGGGGAQRRKKHACCVLRNIRQNAIDLRHREKLLLFAFCFFYTFTYCLFCREGGRRRASGSEHLPEYITLQPLLFAGPFPSCTPVLSLFRGGEEEGGLLYSACTGRLGGAFSVPRLSSRSLRML